MVKTLGYKNSNIWKQTKIHTCQAKTQFNKLIMFRQHIVWQKKNFKYYFLGLSRLSSACIQISFCQKYNFWKSSMFRKYKVFFLSNKSEVMMEIRRLLIKCHIFIFSVTIVFMFMSLSLYLFLSLTIILLHTMYQKTKNFMKYHIMPKNA